MCHGSPVESLHVGRVHLEHLVRVPEGRPELAEVETAKCHVAVAWDLGLRACYDHSLRVVAQEFARLDHVVSHQYLHRQKRL